ncbi:MAG TPA: NAD(+) diphosphatase, partial [Vicinamibacteria bacterium]|nr:NAD(+) diphosphatase [Vicinamibacteria bacterium]
FLSGLVLNRAAELRMDPEIIDRAWCRPGARVLPVWRSKHFVVASESPRIVFVESHRVEAHRETRILLGKGEAGVFFAVDLSTVEHPLEELALDAGHSVMSLREAAPLLPREEGALLAYASAMTNWHRRHHFCGTCGSPATSSEGGHVRNCSNSACRQIHFPRTDPAVIMLVTDGERCLLGRQSAWPERVYSTLAGFVEPGESLEEAVMREVREETGIDVAEVRYHSSQPWPFPSSIMLGFVARARTLEVKLGDAELQDARWFGREELLERRGVQLPSPISIARRLIEDWLAGEL